MMTSPKTMIMIANMNTAATVEAIFSIVASAFNIPSSKIHLPKASILQAAANRVLRLFGGNGRYRRVEFPQRVAAALAAPVESFRSGLGDVRHRLLDLRCQFLPGAVADRIGHDEAAEADAVGGIFDELVGAVGDHALERKQQPVHGAARQRLIGVGGG